MNKIIYQLNVEFDNDNKIQKIDIENNGINDVIFKEVSFITKFSQQLHIKNLECGENYFKNNEDLIETNIRNDYENKMKEIQEETERKIKDIQHNYEVIQEKYERLLYDKQTSIEYERKHADDRYREQIEKLEETNQCLNNKMTNERQYYETKREDLFEKFINSNTNMKEEFNNLQNEITKGKTNSQKCIEGEDMVYQYIERNYSHLQDYEVEQCSSVSAVGDISLRIKDINMCIEVKNWKSKVQTRDVKKFHRDVELNYDCGIICNLNDCGFAKKYNYEIEYIGEKPMMYIQGIGENLQLIDISIAIIMYLMDSNTNEIDNLVKICKESLNTFQSLMETNKNMGNIIKNNNQLMEGSIQNLKNLLLTDKIFECKLCNKTFKSEKTYNTHLTTKTHLNKIEKITI